MKPLLLAVLALALAASASAATPSKTVVWMQASAAWKAQAVAHHAVATCTTARQSTVLGMNCDFGERGNISMSPTQTPCVYGLVIKTPRTGTFKMFERTEFSACKRGWLKALPAPWSYPA